MVYLSAKQSVCGLLLACLAALLATGSGGAQPPGKGAPPPEPAKLSDAIEKSLG